MERLWDASFDTVPLALAHNSPRVLVNFHFYYEPKGEFAISVTCIYVYKYGRQRETAVLESLFAWLKDSNRKYIAYIYINACEKLVKSTRDRPPIRGWIFNYYFQDVKSLLFINLFIILYIYILHYLLC